jgi:hypothetical protein
MCGHWLARGARHDTAVPLAAAAGTPMPGKELSPIRYKFSIGVLGHGNSASPARMAGPYEPRCLLQNRACVSGDLGKEGASVRTNRPPHLAPLTVTRSGGVYRSVPEHADRVRVLQACVQVRNHRPDCCEERDSRSLLGRFVRSIVLRKRGPPVEGLERVGVNDVETLRRKTRAPSRRAAKHDLRIIQRRAMT